MEVGREEGRWREDEGSVVVAVRRPCGAKEEDREVYQGPFIGRARAKVNYVPSPYDKDALRFKVSS